MGRRLKELTSDNTKCMVKVNGVTLIDRALHQLDALGLSKIVIVVGYEGQKLIDYIATLEIATPICYVDNPIYDKTNNIYSLALAKDKLQSRYGGYWRYPSMLDFCYLVNPYFPPRKLIDEMRASFERLLTQYPSGMRVNSLLAARNFDVHQEHIIVGNGAAELIKYLVERHEGKLGCIRPTFEEYPNRCRPDDVVCFWPQNENFAYDADDVTEFFKDKDISMLVLINPDNPSGNYIGKAELLRIADWCEAKGIRMIADESFADFADEEDNSLIDEAILNAHPHLVVVKSISKSYGVPGIRLGVLASADEALIAGMKKDAAIWNINSFGEFYMQIAEKYVKNYAAALRKFKATRKTMGEALGGIPALRVIPSQANYFMLELTGNVSARELTRRLLTEHDILVKDLSAKLAQSGRQYVRVAVRTEEDNSRLIAALKEILK